MTIATIYATTDFHVYGKSTVYATARNTCFGHFSLSPLVGQEFSTPDYRVYRTGLKFDTSILSGAIINQVNLVMTVLNDQSTAAEFDIEIMKYDWSASDPIAAGNRETIYDGILAAVLDDSIWRNTAGMAVDTPYTSGNLSTAWIEKEGSTYYALISAEDRNNSAPPAVFEKVSLHRSNDGTQAYRPNLVVDYYYPALGLLFFT